MNRTDEILNFTSEVNFTSCSELCWERRFTFWLEGVTLPLISMFGIVGNILCVFVFHKKKVDLKPSFSNILKCLSILDSLFLACVIWLYGVPEIMPEYYFHHLDPFFTPFVIPATQIALTGSVYSVVAVSLERFTTICRPLKRNLGNAYDGLGYVFIIIIFSILFNFIKFFEHETVYEEKTDTLSNETILVPYLNLTSLRVNPAYATVNLVVNTAIVGVIPILVVSYLNYEIIRKMKKNTEIHNKICSTERRDQTMKALLTGVVVVLVVCHTPKTVINIYEGYELMVYGKHKFTPLWIKLMVNLSHVLLGVSSAVNILIYSYKDFHFRNVIIDWFTTCKSNRKDLVKSLSIKKKKTPLSQVSYPHQNGNPEEPNDAEKLMKNSGDQILVHDSTLEREMAIII